MSDSRTLKLVLMIDDRSPGFWGTQSYCEVDGFHLVGIADFRFDSHHLEEVKKKISEDVDYMCASERYVITDGLLGLDLEDGSRLLNELGNDLELKWKRAVLYSGDPRTSQLTEENRPNVWKLKKGDFKADIAKMLRFFSTGERQSIAPFVALVGEAIQISNILQVARLEPSGISLERLVEDFEAWSSTPRRLWTLDSQGELGTALLSEFQRHLMGSAHELMGREERGDPGRDVEYVYRVVRHLLDPIDSLDDDEGFRGRSPVRKLWEFVANNASRYFGSGRDALWDPRVGARGRCWVQERLTSLCKGVCEPDLIDLVDSAQSSVSLLREVAMRANSGAEREAGGI